MQRPPSFLRNAKMLAPFKVRAFRIQWPADLATSCALEMELIILGWYVFVTTGSVFWLTLIASAQYLGTWFAPIVGLLGDRVGHRRVLATMRAIYAVLAGVLMVLALTGSLTPLYAVIIAGLTGLVRPSDHGMRATLVSTLVPPQEMMAAISVQRTTQDLARIAGALTGAGLVAALGIGPAYVAVTLLYAASSYLTARSGRGLREVPRASAGRDSPWSDLKAGLAYVWNTPRLVAMLALALLLNGTAFPITMGLAPYVAKEIYGAGQGVLSYMVAGIAFGAFVSSLGLSRYAPTIRAGRVSLIAAVLWLAVIAVYSQLTSPAAGIFVLVLSGIAQGASQTPMNAALLRTSEPAFRGRVMGVRMLVIYSNLPGLLLAGPLIERFGWAATAAGYAIFGTLCIALIVARWGRHLWPRDAITNAR